MSGLSIFIPIAIAFLAMVWYVNRSRGGETRTPEQAQEDWQLRLRGTEGGDTTGFGGGGI
jgi:hypothetical protein